MSEPRRMCMVPGSKWPANSPRSCLVDNEATRPTSRLAISVQVTRATAERKRDSRRRMPPSKEAFLDYVMYMQQKGIDTGSVRAQKYDPVYAANVTPYADAIEFVWEIAKSIRRSKVRPIGEQEISDNALGIHCLRQGQRRKIDLMPPELRARYKASEDWQRSYHGNSYSAVYPLSSVRDTIHPFILLVWIYYI